MTTFMYRKMFYLPWWRSTASYQQRSLRLQLALDTRYKLSTLNDAAKNAALMQICGRLCTLCANRLVATPAVGSPPSRRGHGAVKHAPLTECHFNNTGSLCAVAPWYLIEQQINKLRQVKLTTLPRNLRRSKWKFLFQYMCQTTTPIVSSQIRELIPNTIVLVRTMEFTPGHYPEQI